MPEQSLYCPKCSQKNTDGRIPVLSFVKDIFQNLFNLDSKFFKTAFGLFRPGKLTNEFFTGKHKSFATPSRLFLVSIILLFATINMVIQNKLDDSNLNGDFMGLSEKVKTKEERLAVIEEMRKKALKNEVVNQELLNSLDSMETAAINDSNDSSYMNLKLIYRDYRIKNIDLQTLSADSLCRKYKLENFGDELILKQGLKLSRNPASLVSFVLGNLTWMMLVLIPSVALIFQMIYFRRKKFYVEHLVFLFHVHSFFAILGILFFAGIYFFEWDSKGTGAMLATFISWIYLFLSMKNVYQQSWGKTFLKFLFVQFGYFIVMVICITILFFISFLLF